MQYGFIKAVSCAPDLKVADAFFNADSAIKTIRQAAEDGAELVVLPRLFLTGSTCGSLFKQSSLTKKAAEALCHVADETAALSCVTVIGLPISTGGRLFDCAAVLCRGEIIGITCAKDPVAPFDKGVSANINIGGKIVPMGTDTVYRSKCADRMSFAVEIGAALPTLAPLTVHLSKEPETAFSETARIMQACARTFQSGGALVYCCGSIGESTTDFVYSGAQVIAEKGVILAQSKPFDTCCVQTDIDMELISRTCIGGSAEEVYFDFEPSENTCLVRSIEKDPFMPSYADKNAVCERVLELQARGLAKRMAHTNAKALVLGISGGLDSTLALLVAVRACKILDKTTDTIQAVTMPCFGTSTRTKSNAEKLCEQLNVPLRHINITAAVNQHFSDIGHDGKTTDAAFENSQARERTQVLMDLANMLGGFVVGTGDLSELALGWATYNGDHMSAYAVNADVPKTFIRHIVEYCAKTSDDSALAETLRDIIGTPVSPELLPISGKESDQKTEDIVGPYELHDFYLYNLLKNGYTPDKIKYLALQAFKGEYTEDTIDKWLSTFMRRFVTQQFKRSCMPDGPAVFDFSLSPRAGFNFPSDASTEIYR